MIGRIAWLCVVTAACSSSSTGGSVSGGGFQIEDTISASVATSDGAGGMTSSAHIVFASTSDLCADASASPPIVRKGQHFMQIVLGDITDGVSATPTAPGTYTIYPDTGSEPPKSATLEVGAFDDSCQPIDTADAAAQSGSVTLDAAGNDVFSGSFDVTLNTGDHLTGNFDPAACPGLAEQAQTQPTCQ